MPKEATSDTRVLKRPQHHKLRPTSLEELVDQEHVLATLRTFAEIAKSAGVA